MKLVTLKLRPVRFEESPSSFESAAVDQRLGIRCDKDGETDEGSPSGGGGDIRLGLARKPVAQVAPEVDDGCVSRIQEAGKGGRNRAVLVELRRAGRVAEFRCA